MTTSDKNIKLRILARQLGAVSTRLDNLEKFQSTAEDQADSVSHFLDASQHEDCWEPLFELTCETLLQCDRLVEEANRELEQLRDSMSELKEQGARIERDVPSKPAPIQGDLEHEAPTGKITKKQREAGWATWPEKVMVDGKSLPNVKVPLRVSVKHQDRPGEFLLQHCQPIRSTKMGPGTISGFMASLEQFEMHGKKWFSYQGESLSIVTSRHHEGQPLVVRGRYDVNSCISGSDDIHQIRNLVLCEDALGECYFVDHCTINLIIKSELSDDRA